MYSRRDFLKNSSAVALGSFVLSCKTHHAVSATGIIGRPAGVQLYTAMSIIDADTKGTLQKIAQIGYKEIESAFSRKGGYYGMKPKEFATMVKDQGMTWRSHHTVGAPFRRPPNANPPTGADGKPMTMPVVKNLKENYQELVDDAAEGGLSYLVCSSIPVSTMDEIKTAVDVFNKTGEACKKAGVQFAYHNHTTEFDQVEGNRPFDYILSNTDKDLVKMELDLAWATKAGQNPVDLFNSHPGRFPLWHVKDLDKTSQKPVEVGAGYIDFKPIFANAEKAGMKYYFVEQDGAPQPIENLARSFENLKKVVV